MSSLIFVICAFTIQLLLLLWLLTSLVLLCVSYISFNVRLNQIIAKCRIRTCNANGINSLGKYVWSPINCKFYNYYYYECYCSCSSLSFIVLYVYAPALLVPSPVRFCVLFGITDVLLVDSLIYLPKLLLCFL